MLLSFAIKDFLEDRQYSNVSEATLRNYRLTLKAFGEFCSEKELINVEEVTSQTIKAFLINCQKKGNNPTSTNTKLNHLRIFFSYMYDNDYVKTNPSKKVPKAKEEIRIEVFTEYHIKKILSYYRRMKQRDKTLYAYRDYTLILILLSTGMRIGEVANLKWNDVDLVSHSLTLFGKSRKQQGIPIIEKLSKELNSFRIFCEREFESLPEYVFVTREGTPMGVNAHKCVLKRLKALMKFDDVRLSAHTFRHTYAYNFLRNGGDVFSLQRMLRHSQLRMTQRYLEAWGNAVKEQNDKYNPLNSMDL